MRGNDFVQVSYFSKIPFRYRLSSLLFSICLLVLITIFLDSLLTGGLQTLLLLLFFFALVQIIKKWIVSKREFNLSPFNKLKRFISANKLYEEETREVGANQNGNPRRKK